MILYLTKCPLPDEIYDYEKYKSPNWTLDEKPDNLDEQNNNKSKFIL